LTGLRGAHPGETADSRLIQSPRMMKIN